MATTALTIRIDSDLKRETEEVASAIGLTPTEVFTVFARQFVTYRGFPFPVVAPAPTEQEFAARMDAIYLSMLEGDASKHEPAEV